MVSTTPFLSVYVAWHPKFAIGEKIAEALHSHFRRNLLTNVAGGAGVSVIFRSTPIETLATPLKIDFQDSAATAVVVLVDENLNNDPAWIQYVDELAQNAEKFGLRARVFPVAMCENAYKTGKSVRELNFIRWDGWFGDSLEDKQRKLAFQLTYQFCRMLRVYLTHLEHPDKNPDELTVYLERVRIFISHSKHDDYGEKISKKICDSISSENDLDSFFDVTNIPPGVQFSTVIGHNIKLSAVVAVHTDSFSSREWCRREVLTAKRHNVPFVVANCITDFEERGFPYMGNVPVIRMEPEADHRISFVIARLMDEVLRAFLWKCRIHIARSSLPANIQFLPRAPELISLVTLLRDNKATPVDTVIYPDPPLGYEELDLFESLSSNLQLRSYTQWLALQSL
ncbi:MAG: toll/interleukin-1 receptor domain-containing protein [Pseudorhodoplanes sp.]|jgi:hypothetical protein|nr:toll/interleukin-1 receptor domain-containing protein [Pseudorhodoplanes sp.]